MVKKLVKLSDTEKKRIEAAIAEVEKNTSGEIVCLVTPSSSAYYDVPWKWAALFTAGVSIFWTVCSLGWHWGPPLWEIILSQGLAGLCGYFAGQFPVLKRILISQARRSETVDRYCYAHFTRASIGHTKEQTGILVYLSLLERRVEILADRGIHQKVGEDFWKEEVAQIIRGIREERTTEALVEVIGQMGAKLAQHFPASGRNPNELSNRVIDPE